MTTPRSALTTDGAPRCTSCGQLAPIALYVGAHQPDPYCTRCHRGATARPPAAAATTKGTRLR